MLHYATPILLAYYIPLPLLASSAGVAWHKGEVGKLPLLTFSLALPSCECKA